MNYLIRELRDSTGLTQKAFADLYGIPLSTLRKWEQGESSPASYFVKLLAKSLPATDQSMKRIVGDDGAVYYYDRVRGILSDAFGNTISIHEDLDQVKEKNLRLYISDLFKDFYSIQERFDRDCRYDQEEDIIWTR